MGLSIGDKVFYTRSIGLRVPVKVIALLPNGHVELEYLFRPPWFGVSATIPIGLRNGHPCGSPSGNKLFVSQCMSNTH